MAAEEKRPVVKKAINTSAAGGMTKALDRSGQNHSLRTLLKWNQALAAYLRVHFVWGGQRGC